MIVGLTYDLREEYLKRGLTEEEAAEFDSPRTVEAIETSLQKLGHETERIGHLENLVEHLAAGKRWDMVFNIAEGLVGFAREAQIPALLEAYGIPFTFSDALVLALTLHKGLTKRVVRDQGVPTPDFAVVETLDDARAVDLRYPLFAKPVAEGTGKGIDGASKIETPDQLISACGRLLVKYKQPVLVEEFLPGREFTVGIWGTGPAARGIAVMEVRLLENAEADAYSFSNKENWHDRVKYSLVDGPVADQCVEVALAAWRGLGCRDAGRIDLRLDESGRPNFIEVNPLAGLHPEHSDLPIMCGLADIRYDRLIETIMASALKRTSALPEKRAA
jgi:D-alanine-D-alanine ligase